MHDDPQVTDLVTRASGGDRQAWDALVDRYAPLIWSICRQYRLHDADAHDAGQAVWLHLAGHLGSLSDPAAHRAGWPLPPDGNASGSSAPRAGCPPAGNCRRPRRTSRP